MMKSKFMRVLAAVIAAVVFLTLVPLSGMGRGNAYAAAAIGSVTVDGSTTNYDNLNDLVKKVKDLEDKTFTLNMMSDWGNSRLVIPKNSKVTLNMNGYAYNRGLTKNESDGEVIYIKDKATLTINGGTKGLAHTVNVYGGATDYDKVSRSPATFQGGLIAGGFSSNGAGGIDVSGSGVTLNLNNVTIAGCRSAQTWGTDGYGGGIWVHGGVNSAGKVTLINSTITGCYATNDGGGLYQNNHNKFDLKLVNSHIDGNWCGGRGGGINVRGEDVTITGTEGSTVNNNHSGGAGGGIYIWNDDTSVTGLTVSGNHAAGEGGGIYTLEENIELTGLTVTSNHSDKNGGGIYIYNDLNTLTGIRVTGNSAAKYGGGIYVEDHVDEGFFIKGTSVIKDNTGTGYTKNLVLENKTSFVNFELNKDSEVHMSYVEIPDDWALVTQGKGSDGKGVNTNFVKSPNCIRYLHADNEGWEFRFNPDQRYRKIFYVKQGKTVENTGYPYTLTPSTEVDRLPNGSEDTGKTITGMSGKTYPLKYGYFRSSDVEAKLYYSDGFFDSDPYVYNEQLATLSMTMAVAGVYTNQGGKGPAVDYSYKHAAAREFLNLIGCDDQTIYVNRFNIIRPQTDSIGVTMASRDIQLGDENYTLIPVTIRGGNYEQEWASNVTIGDGSTDKGEAWGFAMAADNVMDAIDTYIKKYDLEEKVNSGKAIFWVTGFSRAGATANLTSKRIRETYHNAKLFGYTFATPRGGSNNAMTLPDEEYFCIHNTINSADLVPYVAMAYMGFIHYGVDHYMPGDAAGEITKQVTPIDPVASGAGNIKQAVTYSDNNAYLTKTNDYETLRNNGMEHQLSLIDPDYEWDDYYHKARLSMNPVSYIVGNQNPFEIEDISERAEDLMKKLMEALQSNVVPGRDHYASTERSYGTVSMNTYQKALRDIMIILYGDNPGLLDRLEDVVGTFSLSDLSDFDIYYLNALGAWSSMPVNKKASLFTILMKHFEDSGLYEGMSDEERHNFEYNIPALLDIALNFLEYDIKEFDIFSDENLQVAGSLAYNGERIFQNHQFPIYLAWLRAKDYLYKDETVAYKVKDATSVPPLTAKPLYDTSVEIKANNTGEPAEFKMHETILLDVTEVGGEAIYYDIENLTTGTKYTGKLYSGGINLDETDKDHPFMDYRITAHARYIEATGDTYTFDIRIIGDTHEVTIDYSGYPDQENVTNYFKEGAETVVMARLPDGLNFKGWLAYDDQGRDVTYLLGDTADDPIGRLTMPMPETDGFSKIYSLRFVPVYEEKVDNAEVIIDEPVYGQELDKTATVILRCGSKEMARLELPVSWSFDHIRQTDKKTINVITDHPAYNSTVYTASVRISETDDFAFGKHVTAAAPGAEDVRSTKNTISGYVNVSVVFARTESGTDWEEEPVELNVEAWDINMNDVVRDDNNYEIRKTMYIDPGSRGIVISAPETKNEAFAGWDALDSGIAISEEAAKDPVLVIDELPESGSVTIRADYVPVVKKITARVIAPAATHTPDDESTMVKVTIYNDYVMDNANLAFDWSPDPAFGPEGKDFDYSTAYTLTIRIVPDENGMVHVTNGGNDYYVTGDFVWSDELVTEIIPIDHRGDTIKGMDTEAAVDIEKNTISISFPPTGERKTDLKYITWPDDIADVPYEQLEAGLESLLPSELEVGVKDQSVEHLPVKWTITQTGGSADGSGDSEWTAQGQVELPERIKNKYGYDLTGSVKIMVNGNAHAEVPTATLPTGIYLDSQIVGFEPLISGGEIRYSLDGSDPVSGTVYNGEYFLVDKSMADDEGYVTLRSVTIAPGLQNSAEAVYLYHFTNEVEVPRTRTLDDKRDGGKEIEGEDEIREVYEGVIPELTYNTRPQVIAYAKPQYSLTGGEGVTIDEDGNALATNAGVYTITAKINDGYVWVITDPETLEKTTTTEDQTFKVAIAKASIANAEIDLEDGPHYLVSEPVTPEVVYVTINGQTLNSGMDYEVDYKDNHASGTGKAIITGTGNFKDSAEVMFEVIPMGADGEEEEDEMPTTKRPSGDEETQPSSDPEDETTNGGDTGPASGGEEGGGKTAPPSSGKPAASAAQGSKTSGTAVKKSVGTGQVASSVSTGDNNLMIMWTAIGGAAAAVAITTIVMARRKNKGND